MSDAAVHQPSPAKRGRGRGRGGAGRGGASTRARGKPAAGRRGRAKVYDHPRAQAAHERQRDLKTAYATIAASMKPALEELADRNLDRLRSDFDAHKEVDEYTKIVSFLDQRLETRLADIEREQQLNVGCTTHALQTSNYAVNKGHENSIHDKLDGYYDTLLRRCDLLDRLFVNGEPVDKLDTSWNYKSITTEEAAQQGIYRMIYNGIDVPYPQLHPELSKQANKNNDPSGLRTPSKRKAVNQPDDEPLLKRPTSLLHIGGMLSAVPLDEPPSQPPSPSPVATDDEDEEEESSPAPDEPARGRRGRKPRVAAASPDETSEIEVDDNPPLPTGASAPDDLGVRTITKRARVNDSSSNRIMVPAVFEYDDLDIGFRDSTNDGSRNGTRAKRKKFLDTPNTNFFLYDRIVAGYDILSYEDGALDQETVRKHNLHPKYGIFMSDSINEAEPPRPYVSGSKPTVFVSDIGGVQHTSRSVCAAKASDMQRDKLKSALAIALEQQGITEDELHDEEYHRLVKERDEKRLKQKQQDDAAQQQQHDALFASNIGALLDAAAAESERLASVKAKKSKRSKSVSPALARPSTRSREYDAIRDSFGGSDVPPAAATKASSLDNSAASSLLLLAGIAMQDAEAASAPVSDPEAGSAPSPKVPGPVTINTQQLTIQMPEPVHPKQLRDPADLEPNSEIVKFTSENPFLPEPLAPQLPQYKPREHVFAVQPPQPYQERNVHQSPLARPDNFAYRETGYGQQMQPPQAQPFMNQQGPQATMGAESYSYGAPEAPYHSPQLRRPSQISQEDHFAPARPKPEDVLDPQLFEEGARQPPSQLQAPKPEQVQQSQRPQSGGVLQQPQNSFFQTALNSPGVSPLPDHKQQADYPEPPQAQQQSGLGVSSRAPPATEGSPGRLPFSHLNGTEQQPLPILRPLQRGSGPLMAPAPQASAPMHFMMTPEDPVDEYAQQQPGQYYGQGFQANGYAPPDQGARSSGYMAQPMMHTSQQPPPPPYPQYSPPGHLNQQPPPQYEYTGPPGQALQSPPPFGNGPGAPPSPSTRGGSTPSSSRNNKNNLYREIQPAPRMAEVEDSINGTELRTLLYNPAEGIRDYNATAPPPTHGPTQIRGWTHTTGSKKSRGKNSTDSQIDPMLGQGERK